MCKTEPSMGRSYIDLSRHNLSFRTKDQIKKDKELEKLFYEKLRISEKSLVSEKNFNSLRRIIDICKRIEKYNNSIAHLVESNREEDKYEIEEKRKNLINLYNIFNNMIKDLRL